MYLVWLCTIYLFSLLDFASLPKKTDPPDLCRTVDLQTFVEPFRPGWGSRVVGGGWRASTTERGGCVSMPTLALPRKVEAGGHPPI